MEWSAGQNEAAFVMVLITKKSDREEKRHERKKTSYRK
jgi:hypothetical protein